MFLAIDLGRRTTGLAISDSSLATPYKTISHKSTKVATTKISEIIDELEVDTIVIGFVEGKIKTFFENFARQLKAAKPNCQIVLWDETLTSRQARESLVKLGIAKKKRGQKEHETAAALILQSYLDSR